MKDEEDDDLKLTNEQKKEALQDLRSRTTDLAVRVIRLGDGLPKKRRSTTVIANQLVRCGTSVGAHYREGARSRSDAELISKLETALQELDETDYWLERDFRHGSEEDKKPPQAVVPTSSSFILHPSSFILHNRRE